MASKSKCVSHEDTVAIVEAPRKRGSKATTPVASAPTLSPAQAKKLAKSKLAVEDKSKAQPATLPPTKKSQRATVATAANATSAPPAPTTKGRKSKASAEPVAPPSKSKRKGASTELGAPSGATPAPTKAPKKDKASKAPPAVEASAPKKREPKWIDERLVVAQTMRRLKATSPARARSAEDIAIEAEVVPFRIKEMGYRGNSTRGQIGTDASPFVVEGWIAIGAVDPDHIDGRAARTLHYWITPAGLAALATEEKRRKIAAKTK